MIKSLIKTSYQIYDSFSSKDKASGRRSNNKFKLILFGLKLK